jgi:hypothetical protein
MRKTESDRELEKKSFSFSLIVSNKLKFVILIESV